MATIFGIRLAPLRIPFSRRLQTFAVLQFVAGIFIYPLLSIGLLGMLLISPFFFVPMLYLYWLYFHDLETPQRGGRRFEWVRRLRVWRYFRDYFPITLVKTAELDPSKNYLIGYHPHGIISCGFFCNFGTEATQFSEKFPGIRPYPLTLQGNFYWPILRGYLMALGLCDVSRASVDHLLSQTGPGSAVVIVVGGAEEALEAHPGQYKLALKHRKGFVRMALKTGAHLVPCFSFGENELFKQASNPRGSWIRRFQEAIKSILRVSPPIFYGRGVFNYDLGMMPFRTPINTVIGAPISVEKIAEPSAEEIDRLHEAYLKALENLFDQHKTDYGIDEGKRLSFY